MVVGDSVNVGLSVGDLDSVSVWEFDGVFVKVLLEELVRVPVKLSVAEFEAVIVEVFEGEVETVPVGATESQEQLDEFTFL